MRPLHTNLAAFLALASAASAQEFTFGEWQCSGAGGPGIDGLEEIHGTFNDLFGEDALRIAYNQCYYAVCDGLIFGYCNEGCCNTWEISGARNDAAETDPGPFTLCTIHPTFNEPYHTYIFATEDDFDPEEEDGTDNDIRYC